MANTITVTLNERELAAIRAGLDLYWCHAYDGFNEDSVRDIASAEGSFEPLNHEETEQLNTRLSGFEIEANSTED